jgi:hypothetical protein
MRGTELGFGGVYLGISSLLRLRRDLEIGPRRPTLRQKRLLALEMIASLRQLPLGGRQTRLRLPQRVQLVLWFKSRQYLPGLHPVPELAAGFQQPPGNPKLTLLNGRGPNWTGCRSGGVCLFLTGREQQCRRYRNERRHQQSMQFRFAGA